MTNKTQFEKFKALAEEAECDTDEKKFDMALKKISEKQTGKKGQSSPPRGRDTE